jgi:hypothetical protein
MEPTAGVARPTAVKPYPRTARSLDRGTFGLDPASFLANNEIDRFFWAPDLRGPARPYAYNVRAFLVDTA